MSHNIPCSWQVPFETHEIKHQLEPGEARPMHTRHGRIVDFKNRTIYNRNGVDEDIIVCVIRQPIRPFLMALPMTQVEVIDEPVDLGFPQ